ncbi:MAG: DUF1559 domain-containing protein [Pirellulales bacterium]|nr:DUF1559 domain-containing protein [Pirellulales bacterium]
MQPFPVQCPTCHARFKVRDRAAIGQILQCPRCTSMLEIKPPAGWRLDDAAGDDSDSSVGDTSVGGSAAGSSGELGSTISDSALIDKADAAGSSGSDAALLDKPAAAPNKVELPATSLPRARRLRLVLASAVLLVVVLVGAGFWWWRGDDQAGTAIVPPTKVEASNASGAAGASQVVAEEILPATNETIARFESTIDWNSGDPVLALLPAEIGYLTDLPSWVAWRRDRRLPEMRVARLGAGLAEFVAAEQGFPVLAAGSNSLPAENRLSWVAGVLPYYGQADWHAQLSFGRGWRDPPNEAIARRVLLELLNPALGMPARVNGYGASHFVGVTGLGTDAATLDINDPRAGVFGATRRATAAQIGDGVANTIALLGVTQRIGPWAAGGAATTRPLVTAPYVNGPDGFGTGQVDGMFAAMADGSVRWISAEADPRVVEQLATINGGEQIELASLDPRQPPPHEDVEPAEAAANPSAEPAGETPPAGDTAAADVPAVGEPSVTLPGDAAAARASGVRGVDVVARLADRVTAIEIPRVPLATFVDFVSRLMGIPCALDIDALRAAGQSARETVSAKLANASVDELLKQTLGEHDLVARPIEVPVPSAKAVQHLLWITRTDAERLVERRLPAADLVIANDGKHAGGEGKLQTIGSLAALGAAVEDWVAPATWQKHGGRGTLTVAGNDLVIKQTLDVQAQIASLVERLRAARRAPARKLQLGEAGGPKSPWPAALDTSLTVTFFDDARLVDVLGYLAERSELMLLVDWRALAAAGWGPDVPAGVRARDQALANVLAALLEPLGLDYRVIDERTLQITSRAALAARPQVEFYPLANLETADRPRAAMLADIEKLLAAPAAGDQAARASVYFDEPSGYVVVSAPAGAQRALARKLGEWNSAGNASDRSGK